MIADFEAWHRMLSGNRIGLRTFREHAPTNHCQRLQVPDQRPSFSQALVIVGLAPGRLLRRRLPAFRRRCLPPQRLQARIAEFERRIVELAGAKAGEPKLRRLSPEERKARIEFVIGNIFFVAMHELGHAVVSELEVPVLGREEDTADVFAIGAAMRIVANEFAHRILMGAANGWFLSARRAKRDGEGQDTMSSMASTSSEPITSSARWSAMMPSVLRVWPTRPSCRRIAGGAAAGTTRQVRGPGTG